MKPCDNFIEAVQVDEDTGSQMIIDLQAVAGMSEPREQAIDAWRSMTKEERAKTVVAHKRICG